MSKRVVAMLTGLAVGVVLFIGVQGLTLLTHEPPPFGLLMLPFLAGLGVWRLMSNYRGDRKMASADAATRSGVLATPPGSGAARVVLLREGSAIKGYGMDVQLDGRDRLQLHPRRFTALETTPGSHTLTAMLAGKAHAHGTPTTVTLDLAPGETAAFVMSLKMRMTTSDVVFTRTDPAALAQKLARTEMTLAEA